MEPLERERNYRWYHQIWCSFFAQQQIKHNTKMRKMPLIRFLSHQINKRTWKQFATHSKDIKSSSYYNHGRLLSESITSVKVAVSAFLVTASSTFLVTATTTTTTTTNTICNGRITSPPRYGKYIPHHLLVSSLTGSHTKRNQPQSSRFISTTTTSTTSSNDDVTTTTTATATTTTSNKEGQQDETPAATPPLTESSTPSSSTTTTKKEECPLCQKYSQGPCGDLFQKWLKCIDSHPGKEAECDSLIVPLDQCLKEHLDYYNSINIYSMQDESDQEVDETVADDANITTPSTVEQWRDFLKELDQEEDIKTIDFPKNQEPKMELRPKDQTGFAMFDSKVQNRHLLLAYMKDQDGNVLAAGSVQDLFPYQQLEDEYYVLRFAVRNKECQSVTAYGLYGKDELDQTEESSGHVRYAKTERIPMEYFQ
jgi:Predicted solute binding protein